MLLIWYELPELGLWEEDYLREVSDPVVRVLPVNNHLSTFLHYIFNTNFLPLPLTCMQATEFYNNKTLTPLSIIS